MTNDALIKTEALNPEEVFKGKEIEKLVAEVKAAAKPELDPDTPEGREERRSLAYKITRSKTAIDNMGKEYVGELKKVTAAIDEKRRYWRGAVEAFADEIRQPLTDFENAEKERIAQHNNRMDFMRNAVQFDFEYDSAAVEERLGKVQECYNHEFEEFKEQAETVYNNTTGRLSEMLATQIKHEESQKELEELRRKQAEQDQKDREEQIKREAEEAADKKAQQAIKDAEDKARREKEREEQESAARAADIEHKRKINAAILKAMQEKAMITDEEGKAIIEAIVRGNIPNVKITY